MKVKKTDIVKQALVAKGFKVNHVAYYGIYYGWQAYIEVFEDECYFELNAYLGMNIESALAKIEAGNIDWS